MAVISTLSVKMDLDSSGFNTAMDAVGRKLKETGASIRQLGSDLTTRVTAPIVAGLGAAVWAASDLNETLNKTTVVFGDAAAGVVAWSEDSATAFGMSQNEALGYASTLGNIFTSMGMAGDEASKLSTDIVALGADLGSFNNVPTADALEAIRAGLLGEYEPLRRFGIVLNEAAVEAKAMELGLVDANGEISEQNKVLARQAIIAEGATNAQGDFAETSGSLANQMKILRARLANAAAAIGQILLPYVTRLAAFISRLVERFDNLSNQFKVVIVVVLAVAAAIGPLLVVVGTLVGSIGVMVTMAPKVKAFMAVLRAGAMSTLGPILLVVAAIAAIYFVWTRDLFGIRTKLTAWFDTFKSPGGTLDKLKARFDAFKVTVVALYRAYLPKAKAAFDRLKVALTQLWDRVKGPLTQFARLLGSTLVQALRWAADNLYRLQPLLDRVEAALMAFGAMVSALVRGDWSAAWDAFKSIVENAAGAAVEYFRLGFEAIKGVASRIDWGAIWDFITSGVGALKDWALDVGLPKIGGAIVSGAYTLWDLIKSAASWLADTGVDVAADWLTSFGAGEWALDVALPSIGGTISSAFSSLWDWIKGLVPWLGDSPTDVATDWVSGFGSWELNVPLPSICEDIKNAFSSAWNWIKAGVSWLANTASDVAGDWLESFGDLVICPSIPSIGGPIVNAFASAWEWIKSGVSWLAGTGVDVAADWLSSFGSWALSLPIPEIAGAIVGAFTSIWGWIADKVSWLAGFIDTDAITKSLSLALTVGLPSIAGKLLEWAGDFWGFVADKVSWLAGFIDSDTITKAISVSFDVAAGAVSAVAGFVDTVMSGIASAAGWAWDKATGAFSFGKDLFMNVIGKGGSDGGDGGGPSFDPIATQSAVEWLAAYDWSALATNIQTGIAGAISNISTWAHGSNGIISTIFIKVSDGQGQGDWQPAFSTESSKVRLGLVKALQAIGWGWTIGGVHKTVFDKVKGAQGGGDWQGAFGQESLAMLKGLVNAIRAISWASVIDAVREQVRPYDGGYAIGDAIGRGMYIGIRSWIADIVDAAVQAVTQAVNAARNAAQVRSPSRKFFEIGAAMGEGLAIGMRESIDMVAATASMMASAAGIAPAISSVGSGMTANTITINVSGAGDPTAVADAVYSRFARELGLKGAV